MVDRAAVGRAEGDQEDIGLALTLFHQRYLRLIAHLGYKRRIRGCDTQDRGKFSILLKHFAI